MSHHVTTRQAGQALVNAYRTAGRTAWLMVFPDGRMVVRVSN